MAALSLWTFSCLGIVLLMANTCSANCNFGPSIVVSGVFVLGVEKPMLCSLLAPVSQENITFEWSHNGTTLYSETIAPSVNSAMVTLQRRLKHVIQAADEGQTFFCTAYFNSALQNSVCSAELVVSLVYTRPSYAIIDGPSAVLGGENYMWRCFSDGASGTVPAIEWNFSNRSRVDLDLYYQNTTVYTSATSGLESYNVTSVLTIPITVGAPNFALECKAVQPNSHLFEESTLSVMVTYPPVVTVSGTNYTGTIQTLITLDCSASAVPAITAVRWYKDGQLLDTASGRYSGSTTNQPSLTIGSLIKSDAGLYVCQASNSLGSDNSTDILLVVRYGPTVTYAENPVGDVLGSDVTVSCLIDAVPQYTTVYWYRVDSNTGTETIISSTSNPGKYSGGTAQTTPSLTIKNLATSDEGQYKCEAHNDLGSGDGGTVSVEIYLTGGSTEDTGLSTATLILIIIICLIILIVIILIIIFCCATGRCKCLKKDNNVSPSASARVPPPVVPISEKPLPVLTTSANGTVSARSAPVSHSANRARPSSRMDVEDEKLKPTLANGTANLGHGLSISVPGGLSPRPHHLPPLGQDGVSEETESALDDKPKKRRRRRRPRNTDDNPGPDNLQV